MRAWLAMPLIAALAGCQPDIGSGVYYCGPERACPPDLACDDATAVCVFETEVDGFRCEAERNATEPDDGLVDAFDAGTAACGPAISQLGCTAAGDDVDHLRVTTPAACGDVLSVELEFSVAFAPLTVDILGEDGAVLATGEVCDDLDASGQVTVCAEVAAAATTPYVVRVRTAEGGPDCDGTCSFNRYLLTIF